MTHPAPTLPPLPVDLGLVVVDMDGTLLDGDGEIPEGLWPLLERMTEAGIGFVPASGRQYATLARQFDRAPAGTTFIAENGAYVVRDGVEVSSVTLPRVVVEAAVARARAYAASDRSGTPADGPVGTVVCGKRSAYVESAEEAFLAQARRYYAALEVVPDVLAVDDDIVKVAVWSAGGSEVAGRPDLGTGSAFADLPDDPALAGAQVSVVVSGAHWLDVMDARVDKGAALRALQERLGVDRSRTAAFGDYLNDLEMLDAAALSFAMAGAHPDVHARAAYVAPPHTDAGVLTVLEALLP